MPTSIRQKTIVWIAEEKELKLQLESKNAHTVKFSFKLEVSMYLRNEL